jgi:hypothetical protein
MEGALEFPILRGEEGGEEKKKGHRAACRMPHQQVNYLVAYYLITYS